jgi:hypothetical protein
MKMTEGHIKMIVGLSVILLMFLITAAIIQNPSLKENTLLIHLLGVIEGALMIVVGYYFGSSKSSQDKDKRDRDEASGDDL